VAGDRVSDVASPILRAARCDSSIGMNVAAIAMRDSKLLFDVNR